MNYLNIYTSIINRAKTREVEGYSEKHHIIPKSLGGTNKKENTVQLTAREHFICHLLLVEIHPNNSKLLYAAWAMANRQRTIHQKRDYKVSSRLYETLKREVSDMKKNRIVYLCKYCGKKTERQVSQKQENMFCSRECYLAAGGITKGEVHIYKGNIQKFIPKKEVNSYLKQGWIKGRLSLQKRVLQYTKEGTFIKEYPSVKKATESGEFSVTGISQCANGKRKTHRGFKWKYES